MLKYWVGVHTVVAVINVDACPFSAFSDLTCHLENTGIGFSGCTVLPGSRETELGNSDQEASPSAGKNTSIVLVPYRTWKCAPIAISGGADIFEVPVCHLL